MFQVAGALSPHVLSVQNVYGTGRKGMPRAGQKSQLLVVLLTHKIIAHPSPREAWFSDMCLCKTPSLAQTRAISIILACGTVHIFNKNAIFPETIVNTASSPVLLSFILSAPAPLPVSGHLPDAGPCFAGPQSVWPWEQEP